MGRASVPFFGPSYQHMASLGNLHVDAPPRCCLSPVPSARAGQERAWAWALAGRAPTADSDSPFSARFWVLRACDCKGPGTARTFCRVGGTWALDTTAIHSVRPEQSISHSPLQLATASHAVDVGPVHLELLQTASAFAIPLSVSDGRGLPVTVRLHSRCNAPRARSSAPFINHPAITYHHTIAQPFS